MKNTSPWRVTVQRRFDETLASENLPVLGAGRRDPARFWRFATAILGYVAVVEAAALVALALWHGGV